MGWMELKTKMIQAEQDLKTNKQTLQGYGEISIEAQQEVDSLCDKIKLHIDAIKYFAEQQREMSESEKTLENVRQITAAPDFKKTIFRDPNGKITHIVFEASSINKKATMYPDERDPEKKYVITAIGG